MTLDAFPVMTRRPLVWREFFVQVFSIVRASTLPAVTLAIPFAVLVIFEVMLFEIPSLLADTVLVLAAAGATAVCVDVSSYAIREGIDRPRADGADSIRELVVPRVLAGAAAAVLLSFVAVAATGVFFSVLGQHTPLSQFIGEAQPNVIRSVLDESEDLGSA